MKFSESYIGKIRQKIGHDRLITATADVVAISSDEKICLVFNKDFNSQSLPAGHVEIGDTWQQGAARELLEEAGLKAEPSDLIPFATISGKGYMHDYPNGDLVAPFTLVFYCNKQHAFGNMPAHFCRFEICKHPGSSSRPWPRCTRSATPRAPSAAEIGRAHV